MSMKTASKETAKAPKTASIDLSKSVELLYENHSGERRIRLVVPLRFYFGASRWHDNGGTQWLLDVLDVERRPALWRTFAMKGISAWHEQTARLREAGVVAASSPPSKPQTPLPTLASSTHRIVNGAIQFYFGGYDRKRDRPRGTVTLASDYFESLPRRAKARGVVGRSWIRITRSGPVLVKHMRNDAGRPVLLLARALVVPSPSLQ